MRKLFAAFAVFAGLLALAVVFLSWFVPQDYARQRINLALARTSGLRLAEARHIGVSLFPPGVTVDGAVMVFGGRAGLPGIRAERVFAAVEPSSLLQRRPAVSRVVVRRPQIDFRAGLAMLDGMGSTRFAAVQEPGAMMDDAAPVAATLAPRQFRLPRAEIEIIDGSLGGGNGGGDEKATARHVNLILRKADPDGPAQLTGSMQLLDEDVRLEASAADPGGSGASAPVRFSLESRAVRWTLDGHMSLLRIPRFEGTARLEVLSGPALAAWLGRGNKALASLDRSVFDGQVEMSPNGLVLSDARLTGPGTEGLLDAQITPGGSARATLRSLTLHGGRGHGQMTLDASDRNAAVLAGSLELTGVDTLALSSSVSNFDWISGRANATVQFAGGGRSVADIAETLAGKGRIEVTKGALEGLDLPLIVARVKEGEIGKWRREAGRRTEFDSFSASFTLEKGIAATNDIALSGPNVTATGEGETNLAHQQVNYRLHAKVTARDTQPGAGGETAALDVPLTVKGDWQKPDIRPDMNKALKDKDALAGNAKLFGKSVEKLTKGKVKAEEFSKTIDSLFGKKKKADEKPQGQP